MIPWHDNMITEASKCRFWLYDDLMIWWFHDMMIWWHDNIQYTMIKWSTPMEASNCSSWHRPTWTAGFDYMMSWWCKNIFALWPDIICDIWYIWPDIIWYIWYIWPDIICDIILNWILYDIFDQILSDIFDIFCRILSDAIFSSALGRCKTSATWTFMPMVVLPRWLAMWLWLCKVLSNVVWLCKVACNTIICPAGF